MEVTLKVDPEKLREESPIYKNLNLLVSYNYEYCKALNRSDVAYELANRKSTAGAKKGELEALAKKKIDGDVYLHKRNKSWSAVYLLMSHLTCAIQTSSIPVVKRNQ